MKKISLILCALLLLGTAQAAVRVRLPEGAAILNEDGTEIFNKNQYEDATVLYDDLYAVKINGKYALANADGALLTDAEYGIFRRAGENLSAKLEDHWVILNREGKPFDLYQYDEILPAGDCYLALCDTDNDRTELCSIDCTGICRETGLYVNALGDEFVCGLAAVRMSDTNLYGYCDKTGSLVIPAVFDFAGDYAGNRAAVVQSGKYGAIDETGNMVVPAEFDFLQVSEEGLILAEKYGEGVFIYSSDGTVRAHYADADSGWLLPDGRTIICGEHVCVYDVEGNRLLTLPGDASVYAGINGQLIVSEGAWGEFCVYIQGTDARYQNIYPLGTACGEAVYAYLTVRTGRYMNDMLGEIQYSFDTESARYGVIDGSGNILLDAVYRSVDYLCDDRLLVQTEDQWQMIDVSGKVYWQTDAKTDSERSA